MKPNLTPGFWTGSQADYFKLYNYSARAVKSVNTAYRIGGPEPAGAAWEAELIGYCEKNGVPIDFISTHAYGVRQGYLDEYGQSGTVLDKNPMSVSGDVLRSRSEIEASSKPGLELHYTEWSSSYTPSDPIHDSYHEAPYILQKIKQTEGAVNSMSYWVFTDIFEVAVPSVQPFHSMFGLLTIQGTPTGFLRLPVHEPAGQYGAGKPLLVWICKDGDGNIQALLWDYTHNLPSIRLTTRLITSRISQLKFEGKVKIYLLNVPAWQVCHGDI